MYTSTKGDNYANVEQEKEASLKTLKIGHSDGEYTIKYKKGMTWGEWAISSYNTTNITIDGNFF